jgi:hypothetical protein
MDGTNLTPTPTPGSMEEAITKPFPISTFSILKSKKNGECEWNVDNISDIIETGYNFNLTTYLFKRVNLWRMSEVGCKYDSISVSATVATISGNNQTKQLIVKYIKVDDNTWMWDNLADKYEITQRKANRGGKSKPKCPQPSAERVKDSKGRNRVVYVGPKGGKYIKKDG